MVRAKVSQNVGLSLKADLRTAAGDGAKQPTFEIEAYTGVAVSPDSPYLDAQMVIDLATATSRDRITAIVDHDDTQIVGQTDRVEIGESSVRMYGKVTGDWTRPGEPAEKVVTHAKNGFVWPVSVGGSIGRLEYVEPEVEVEVNGKAFVGPIYIARNVNLRHIAFLSDPADQDASAKIAAKAASNKEKRTMDFETWLSGLGFDDPAALSEDQRAALRKKFDDERDLRAASKKKQLKRVQVDDDDDDDAEPEPRKVKAKRASSSDPLAELKARRERVNKIDELMQKYAERYPDSMETIEVIGIKAKQDDGMSLVDVELSIVREIALDPSSLRNGLRGPGIHTGGAKIDPSTLEVALCRSANLPAEDLVKQYDERTVETAHRRWPRGLSLREFLEIGAQLNGYRGSSSLRQDMHGVLEAAFSGRSGRGLQLGVGPSTYDISDITGNVLNRIVVKYFEGVDLTALRAISATRPVSDFRQIEAYSLTGDLTFVKIPPGGEITHGTLGNEKYTNQADTYGRIIGIDRRDIINDDIGALASIGQRMGRGGALALGDVGWTAFIDNSTFFSAGHSNYLSGADTALSVVSLTAAKTEFNLLTDPNGKPMNIAPRILLVPPELEGVANQIIRSPQLMAADMTNSADTLIGSTNIHTGTLAVSMARELSNASYTGYSALKWYILADPMNVPTIELCFLNGVDRPTVERVDFDPNRLGMAIRGYFDFGAAQHEYRGGVAMKGEV